MGNPGCDEDPNQSEYTGLTLLQITEEEGSQRGGPPNQRPITRTISPSPTRATMRGRREARETMLGDYDPVRPRRGAALDA